MPELINKAIAFAAAFKFKNALAKYAKQQPKRDV